MSQPIDRVYVEIEARGEDDAAREIKKSLDKIAQDVKKLSNQVEASFAEASREIEQEMTEAGNVLTKEAAHQRKEWEKTGATLALAMKEASTSAGKSIDNFADEAVRDMNRITAAAARAAIAVDAAGSGDIDTNTRNITLPSIGGGGTDRDVDRLGRSASGLRGIFNNIRDTVQDLVEQLGERLSAGARQAIQSLAAVGGTISAILGPIGSFIASLGLLGVALALAPVIIPLIAALSQLSALMFLLPGAIGVLISAIIPLVMAFKGVGAAVSALASGDLDKINEAMKKISPQARKFAVEVHSLRDELKQLKFAVQDAFFKEFNGALSALVKNTLPLLTTGLSDIATALGKLGAGIAQVFGTPKAIAGFRAIFDSTTTAIENLTGPLMNLFTSLFGAIKAAQPFVDRMFKSLGNGVQNFADWLAEATESGDLKRWLESAFTVAKDLGALLASIGRLFGAIFGGLGDEGDSFIVTLTKIIDKMTEFFASDEGKKWVSDLVNVFLMLANALITVVDWVSTASRFIAGLQASFYQIGAAVKAAALAIGDFFSSLWAGVQDIGGAVGEWFTSVGQWFSDAWTTITETGGEILQWFEDLPGKVGAWLSTLPGIVGQAFQDVVDTTLYLIGFATGFIVREFFLLPGQVWAALEALGVLIVDSFTTSRDYVIELVTATLDAVVSTYNNLRRRTGEILVSTWKSITGWFTRTKDDSVATTRSTVDSVIGWFNALPGRAAIAISALPGKIKSILNTVVAGARDVGRNIMEGVATGIRNGWNSAINAAKDAARQVLRGFWDALNIGSPSRLMRDEVGKPIMQGVGVGIEREIPNTKSTINSAMRTVTSDVTGNGSAASSPESTAAAATTTVGSSGGIVIQSLSIPIQGAWNMDDPQAARQIAMRIYTALEDLKKDYR